jgi:hypothetical protein
VIVGATVLGATALKATVPMEISVCKLVGATVLGATILAGTSCSRTSAGVCVTLGHEVGPAPAITKRALCIVSNPHVSILRAVF